MDVVRQFLLELETRIKNDELTNEEITSVCEFYYKIKFLKDYHTEADLTKYCSLGYHIYQNVDKQNSEEKK